ncbi:MAG: sigma-70 family RNA polymerase sigma factor [Bacteroidota bacterium]
MDPLLNSELVELLRRGQRLGCSRLVSRYRMQLLHRGVRDFGLRLVEAEEVADDVLLAVMEKIGSFRFRRSESDFHYWVMAILRNRARDLVRRDRHRREHTELLEDLLAKRPAGEGCLQAAAIAALEEEEPGSTVWDAALHAASDVLETMEDWERTLLRCRAVRLPYREIEFYTGKPAGHLKVYHGRVMRKFRMRFARAYPATDRGHSAEKTGQECVAPEPSPAVCYRAPFPQMRVHPAHHQPERRLPPWPPTTPSIPPWSARAKPRSLWTSGRRRTATGSSPSRRPTLTGRSGSG